MKNTKNTWTSPSVERAVRIMNTLAAGGEHTSLGLARQLNISQSSVYRILQTLEKADWIRAASGKRYVFSRGLRPFVAPLLEQERSLTRVQPALDRLADELGLAAKCSLLEGHEQVTIARAESPQPIAVTSPVGSRFPAVIGASGACLLSQLRRDEAAALIAQAHAEDAWEHESEKDLRLRMRQIRRTGLAENIERHPQGIDSISAPVRLLAGPATLTLIGLRGDFARRARHILCRRRLKEAAKRLTLPEAPS